MELCIQLDVLHESLKVVFSESTFFWGRNRVTQKFAHAQACETLSNLGRPSQDFGISKFNGRPKMGISTEFQVELEIKLCALMPPKTVMQWMSWTKDTLHYCGLPVKKIAHLNKKGANVWVIIHRAYSIDFIRHRISMKIFTTSNTHSHTHHCVYCLYQ